MKAFVKTYWLELLFFAVGFVGAVLAMPFLPRSIPLQFQGDGTITRTGPRWMLFLIPLVQLVACYGFHWWIGQCLEKLPALAPTLSGVERLLPAVLSIILLAAWGVTVPVGTVMLIELLLVPLVFVGFVAVKIIRNIGNLGKGNQ